MQGRFKGFCLGYSETKSFKDGRIFHKCRFESGEGEPGVLNLSIPTEANGLADKVKALARKDCEVVVEIRELRKTGGTMFELVAISPLTGVGAPAKA
jgi:hypothetical protein